MNARIPCNTRQNTFMIPLKRNLERANDSVLVCSRRCIQPQSVIGIWFATDTRAHSLNTTTTFRYRVRAASANLHMCRSAFFFCSTFAFYRVTSATLCPHTMAPYWTLLKSNWIFSSCKHFNKSMRAFVDTL